MGIEFDEIHQVADEIAKSGDKPTLAKVRKKLGGGSYTTISEAMQDWREKEEAKNKPKPIEIPSEVNDLGRDFIEEIYKAALLAAEKSLQYKSDALEEERHEFTMREKEAIELTEQLENEIESLTEQNNNLESELGLISEKLSNIEKEKSDFVNEKKVIEITNEQMKAQIEKMERKNTKLENELIKIAKANSQKKE